MNFSLAFLMLIWKYFITKQKKKKKKKKEKKKEEEEEEEEEEKEQIRKTYLWGHWFETLNNKSTSKLSTI